MTSPTVVQVTAGVAAGGANRAAWRLHRALNDAGTRSAMLVGDIDRPDVGVQTVDGQLARWRRKMARSIDKRVPRTATKPGAELFTPGLVGALRPRDVDATGAAIAHLHWIGSGVVDVASIARWTPRVVWTLHDMWAFTGGCHYDQHCGRWTESCGECPQLVHSGPQDASRIGHRARAHFRHSIAQVITPSHWLAECARASTVLGDVPVDVVPNPLDLGVFRPVERVAARRLLGLPETGTLVLFGAQSLADRRKGGDILAAAVRHAREELAGRDVSIVLFGTPAAWVSELSLPVHALGALYDESALACVYAACDVLAFPTRQDNLPNTLAESIACGTPVVASDVGGVGDLVRDGETGRLVRGEDPVAFAASLVALIDCVQQDAAPWRSRCRDHARATVDAPKVAARIAALYDRVLA